MELVPCVFAYQIFKKTVLTREKRAEMPGTLEKKATMFILQAYGNGCDQNCSGVRHNVCCKYCVSLVTENHSSWDLADDR